MKQIPIFLFLFLMTSCHFISKEGKETRKITLEWHDREIIIPHRTTL